MDIRYVKANIDKISEYDLIKMIVDMILENTSMLENYDENKSYKISDRVYINENGNHYVYQCIVNNITGKFDKSKWVPLFKIYNGPQITFNTIRIREEVYIPNESVNNYTIKLDFNTEQTSVAIYRGMIRFVKGVDFNLDGKKITFTKPLNPNERIIIELRERLGIIPNIILGIVLYDVDDNPYNVIITDNGVIQVIPIDDKDEIRDLKRVTLLYGEKKYNLMVDNSKNKPTLGIFEDVTKYIKSTDGKIYSIIVQDDNSYTLKYEPNETDGVEYIMGTDKRFYEFNIDGNNIKAIMKNDNNLKPEDYNIGFRMKSIGYRDKMLDVKYGNIRIIDYLPNNAYNNIRLRSRMNGNIYNVILNDDLTLSINDIINDGTNSPIFDELYFYDYDLANWKMYIDERNNLSYESCNEVVIRDSRGINIISENGVLAKIYLLPENKIDVIRFVDCSKQGTFKSPLEYGFVIKRDKKELITLDKNSNNLILKDTNTNLVFKTNEHYLLGSDNKLYMFNIVNNNVSISMCDINDFIIENKRNKIILKCNNIINIIDIKNNVIFINPITTMVHRLKSEEGNGYLLDVEGERNSERIKLIPIDKNHKYVDEGIGYMYIKNNKNECFRSNINEGDLSFIKTDNDDLIDYNITNVVNTSKGWYRFVMIDNNLQIEKIFNNIFSNSLCYDMSRDFIMTTEKGDKYSLYIDGNCNLTTEHITSIIDKYILLRSNNDKVYSIGVNDDNKIITYQSYIEKGVKIDKVLYIKDIITHKYNMIYMDNDSLTLETINTAPSTSTNELYIYNKYDDIYTIISVNNELIIVDDVIDKITDKNGNAYSISIDKGELIFELYIGNKNGLNIGPLKLRDLVTNVNYKIYNNKGDVEFENTSEVFSKVIQPIRTVDNDVFILSLFENKISINRIDFK